MTLILKMDDREDEKHLAKLREAAPKFGFETDTARFEVSDYHIGDLLGVEHKADDFVPSIEDGRLFQQAYELSQNFAIPIIVVDRDYTTTVYANRYSKMNPGSIQAAIASLYVHYRVPVFFCGPGNLVTTVLDLARKATDGKTPDASYTPTRAGPKSSDLQVRLVRSLSGIGAEKAKEVLRTYHTPLNAFQNHARWKDDVKGIGKTLNEKVSKTLTEEYVE